MIKLFLLNSISQLSCLSACNTIPVLVLRVESKAPAEIANHNELALMLFDRITIKIKRDEPIGYYYIDILEISECAGIRGNVFLNNGRVLTRNKEFSDLFYAKMKNANFNFTESPNKFSQISLEV